MPRATVSHSLPLTLAMALTLVLCTNVVTAEPSPLRWDRSESSVALVRGQQIIWQFNHGATLDVPYFHPLSTGGGRVLTWDQPPDHAWHHGLWFGWKYINGVNYWEHDRQTGKPAGRTETTGVQVETRDDHSARLLLALAYHAGGDEEVVLRERRRIDISAPNAHDEYTLDWTAQFTAGNGSVELDRTPPKEQSWGGYAGLSVRFAKALGDRQASSDQGPVQFGPGDRHRSRASSIDYSGVIDGDRVGMAILDHPDNPRHPTPWYIIRSPVTGYMNAALLNDEPMTIEPGGRMTLRYRVIVHPLRWDAARLKTEQTRFLQSSPSF
ncbi:hypothetical protein Enr13x_54640 [Stieleria neptunia]|uniref:Methane oxygenase PmoA n=1 Tax=Stieleria neptunia TaxID=2527979 RepID=A0A518HXJ5_9BACT|nr:PmoA family protein [Stieleria neptunia]QDV45585.1 hypothetical protein Enr13x_54640 [Stieleria neptunia]